jgi:hypothetical protein
VTKSRLLGVLILLVVIDLALVNQNWFTGHTGESNTLLELTGTKTSTWLSPLLVLALVTAFVGFYVSGKITAMLLIIESLAIAAGMPLLFFFLGEPAQAIAKSGLVEKATGQSGTIEELSQQVSSATSTWIAYAAVILISLTASWVLITGLRAWRWKKTKRINSNQPRATKAKKTTFDLWDSQRG